jgi:hypothetical protein
VSIAEVRETSLVLGVDPWVRVPDVVAARAELMEALTQRLCTIELGAFSRQVEVRLLDGQTVR